jgi:hypothetical protein
MRGSFSTMTETVEYRWSFLVHKAVATANPAFRKAGISIGSCSDARLNPNWIAAIFQFMNNYHPSW